MYKIFFINDNEDTTLKLVIITQYEVANAQIVREIMASKIPACVDLFLE